VLQPGTVLVTLVPTNDPRQAEVWVTHDDAGLVGAGHPAKLRLATYPFQEYGMIDGEVKRINPDASDLTDARGDKGAGAGEGPSAGSGYRTLVSLKTPYLEADGGAIRSRRGCRSPRRSTSARERCSSTSSRRCSARCTRPVGSDSGKLKRPHEADVRNALAASRLAPN
jgi:hypothetical protein